MINAAELAELRRDSLDGMPDTCTILRPTTVNGPGGQSTTYASAGTSACRLTASVLSGGGEQLSAGQRASTITYMLTVPAGTDIRPSDRIQVGASTFEVLAIKGNASFNMTDTATLVEVRR